MEFALIVWAITTLFPGIQWACLVLLTAAILIAGLYFVIADCTYDKEASAKLYQEARAFIVKIRGWVAVFIILLVIVPSQKSAWMIAGAGAAQAIATSDFAQELGAEAKDMLKEMMKRGTAELREQASETTKEEAK